MLEPGQPLIPTVAALGPELYGGTSGIAIFLAQLFALTGELELRRTAEGAIRQALAQAAPLEYQYAGLERYWRKRAEREAA